MPEGGIAIAGGPTGDVLGAQGGAGTGGPRTDRVVLQGLDGADGLTGGEGGDVLLDGGGNDTLSGLAGDDALVDSEGDDALDGGAGADTAEFSATGPFVTVDLGIAGPQNTGQGSDSLANLENVGGSPGADVVRGDAGPNTLLGRDGADLLEGRGGNDTLEGGDGSDLLLVRDGGPDRADCGGGSDTAEADLPGLDSLLDCENPLFPMLAGPRAPLRYQPLAGDPEPLRPSFVAATDLGAGRAWSPSPPPPRACSR